MVMVVRIMEKIVRRRRRSCSNDRNVRMILSYESSSSGLAGMLFCCRSQSINIARRGRIASPLVLPFSGAQ